MEIKVDEVGIFKWNGRSYPWRLLSTGLFQVFFEERNKWISQWNLSEAVLNPQ